MLLLHFFNVMSLTLKRRGGCGCDVKRTFDKVQQQEDDLMPDIARIPFL